MSEIDDLWQRLRGLVSLGNNHGQPLGLALSGGAVRGAAHIGVLELLDREGIQVERVAGTSVGAIVGAAYAAGHRPASILEEFRDASWLSLGSPRLSLDFRGLLDSDPLERLLRERFGLTTFDGLEIPFRCVACDIARGERVVLSEGDVVQAVLASSAMAGLFRPVEIDGRPLIDGGYLDNLPAREVHEMGAETVIAVDLLADPVGPGEPRHALEIWQRVLCLMIRNAQPAPDRSDVLVHPELSGFSYMDFDDVEAIYERGLRAAQQSLPRIRETLGET